MSILNNKIECIKRLIKLDHHHELTSWMIEAKIVTVDALKANSKSDQYVAELIYLTLKQACTDEKIILLDYEWTILPKERIKVLIITEKESQSFIYEA
jgi:hypothetical protein